MFKFIRRLPVRKCGQKTAKSLHTLPNFTINDYDVTRGNFNCLEESHLNFFRNLLSGHRIVTDLSDLEKHNVDWFRQLRGKSAIVLKPKTTEEVSKILSFCNNNRLAVCPQGGHTGMVGAGTPVFDEIVLSTELMNEIFSFDDSGVLTCQSGCILGNLNSAANERNLIVPLDLGSKGSCMIGGNLSTNAGGLRVLRYGNLHGNVLGVEAVLASGEVLSCLSNLKKDNTGYHLKHLFIGSEGTLGVITKVSLQCQAMPKTVNLAFLGLNSFDKVVETYRKSRENLDEILSAFEVMDKNTVDMISTHLGLKPPIGTDHPFYVIVETSGSDANHDTDKLSSFLEYCMDKDLVLDGTTTAEPSKIRAMWEIRERVTDAILKDGYVFLYDVSLPLNSYYKLVEDMRKYMGPRSHRVFGFGHMADSNLHLQISVKKFSTEIKKYIEPYIFEKVKEYNGSISAEHGMGFQKAKYLPMMKSQSAISLMRNVKQLMDPNGILNPYKVLPS